ncbi:SGNH/GDSL hydrolase family protein [Candidatus Gracilibacteria bacterium]|nr:SGNH/GDSL hydrolase family protein [Candidatus Gracilibacteria bacterium]
MAGNETLNAPGDNPETNNEGKHQAFSAAWLLDKAIESLLPKEWADFVKKIANYFRSTDQPETTNDKEAQNNEEKVTENGNQQPAGTPEAPKNPETIDSNTDWSHFIAGQKIAFFGDSNSVGQLEYTLGLIDKSSLTSAQKETATSVLKSTYNVSGKGSEKILEEARKYVAVLDKNPALKPKTIVLFSGVNDIPSNSSEQLEKTIANVKATIKLFNDLGIKVLMPSWPQKNGENNSSNLALQKALKDNPNVHWYPIDGNNEGANSIHPPKDQIASATKTAAIKAGFVS